MSNLVVGVGDMKLSNQRGDILVTHALGSCLGIVIHDAVAGVGGLLHVMLPSTECTSREKVASNPYMFVDTGTVLLFKQAYALGALKERLVVKVAGGAALQQSAQDFFAIGKRNFLMLRKLLWQNGVMLAGQDVGGNIARTLFLEVGTGRMWLQSNGKEWEF
jgi:chemotaxis protein CheD